MLGNVNLYAVWAVTPPETYAVSYDPGGTRVTGLPAGATVAVGDTYTVSTSIPRRAGYKFVGWTSDIGDFKPGDTFTMPDSAVVLTAVWDSDSAFAGEEDIDEPGTPEEADDANIGNNGIPLFGKAGYNWALLNLILAILGLLAAIAAIVRSRRKDKEEDEYGDKENRRKARKTWVIVSIAAAILGVIVFILTEDMSLPMAWLDKWTIVNAVLFIVGILGTVFASKKQDEDDTQAEY
jgi:uncharacterized repeat protein (TIGR02543 family)